MITNLDAERLRQVARLAIDWATAGLSDAEIKYAEALRCYVLEHRDALVAVTNDESRHPRRDSGTSHGG